jgi:hypothetical protein
MEFNRMLDVEGSLENTGCKKAISWNTGFQRTVDVKEESQRIWS